MRNGRRRHSRQARARAHKYVRAYTTVHEDEEWLVVCGRQAATAYIHMHRRYLLHMHQILKLTASDDADDYHIFRKAFSFAHCDTCNLAREVKFARIRDDKSLQRGLYVCVSFQLAIFILSSNGK